MKVNIQKLRIYAMVIRLHEIETERRDKKEFTCNEPFDNNSIEFRERPKVYKTDGLTEMYDKKGRLLPEPKSKYHK